LGRPGKPATAPFFVTLTAMRPGAFQRPSSFPVFSAGGCQGQQLISLHGAIWMPHACVAPCSSARCCKPSQVTPVITKHSSRISSKLPPGTQSTLRTAPQVPLSGHSAAAATGLFPLPRHWNSAVTRQATHPYWFVAVHCWVASPKASALW